MVWDLLITSISNGYLLTYENDFGVVEEQAIVAREYKDCGHDEKVQEALLARDLLWAVVEYYCLDGGDKYAQRRVKVCLERGSKFEGEDTYKDEWGELFRYPSYGDEEDD